MQNQYMGLFWLNKKQEAFGYWYLDSYRDIEFVENFPIATRWYGDL